MASSWDKESSENEPSWSEPTGERRPLGVLKLCLSEVVLRTESRRMGLDMPFVRCGLGSSGEGSSIESR